MRYPNGIPEETPEVFFTLEDAKKAREAVKNKINRRRNFRS
jgi:hypothetical protein